MNDSTTQALDDAPTQAGYRWYVLGLLFLVSVLNTVDKLLIPALAEPLRQEFNLSDSQIGFLAGIAFSSAYAIAAIPMGLLIDRVNRARLLAVLLMIWSAMTLLSARASSLFSLTALRMGVAAAESGGNPTSLSIISDYFAKSERGKAVGIFTANVAVATFIVYSLSGYVASEYGWRTMFIIAAIPGLLLALLILLTLREPVRGAYDPPEERAQKKSAGVSEAFKEIVSNRTLLWVIAGGVLVIMCMAGLGAFKPTFFVRVHGMSLTEAGFATGLVMAPASALGAMVGGFLTDRARKQKPGGGFRVVTITSMLAVPFGAIGFLASSYEVAIAFIFLYNFTSMCFYAATLSGIMELSPLKIRGSVITYSTLILNLGGYGLGPQVTGLLSDGFKLLGAANPLQWGMAASTSLMFLGALCFLAAARRLDSHK